MKNLYIPRTIFKNIKNPHNIVFKSKSIGTALLLTVILIVLSVSITVSLTAYIIAKDSLLKKSTELLYNKAYDSGLIVDERINNYLTSINSLGSLELLSNVDNSWEQKLTLLQTEKKRLNLSNIGIATTDGSLKLDNYKVVDIGDFWFFKQASLGLPSFSAPFYREESGKVDIAMAAPLKHDRKVVGVVVAYKDAEEFYGIAEGIHIGETGYAYIIDENIDAISHPTLSINMENNAPKPNLRDLIHKVDKGSKGQIEYILKEIREKNVGVHWYEQNGEKIYIGYAPVPSKGWSVLIHVTEKEILSGLYRLNILLPTISIAALIIGILFSYLISKNLSNKIVNISHQTASLAELDLSFSIDEKVRNRTDEIGIMATSIQSVINNIKAFAQEIQTSSHYLSSSSINLTAITQESYAASNSVAEAANNINTKANIQLQEILNMSKEMKDAKNSFDFVLKQINYVKELSNKAYSNTHRGKESMEEVIVQMANIKNSSQKVKHSLEDINISSKKMDGIILVIEELAEKTNLLALNAAIEAARAGDYGRGFSVVAEEIRLLADQTKYSTNEINKLIKDNQSIITYTNQNMDYSNGEIDKGIQTVNETKLAFDEISTTIDNVVEEINESTIAIDSAMDNLHNSMNSMTKAETITNEVTMEINSVSASTNEQMTSMAQVTSSTDSLADLADNLKNLANKIKLAKD